MNLTSADRIPFMTKAIGLSVILFSVYFNMNGQFTSENAPYTVTSLPTHSWPESTVNVGTADSGPYSSFAGIYMGSRTFSGVPDDIYLDTDTISTTKLDLGKGKPFVIGLYIMAQPAESGFAFPFKLEGFLGTTSGIGFHAGVGYKLGSERFSFTPNMSVSVNRLWTTIDSYELDSLIIPASWFDSGSEAYFVGPNASNLDRGKGKNLGYKMSSSFFQLNFASNISFRMTDKIVIFGELGYNYVFATTKNKYEINGSGYDNFDQLVNSKDAPHAISIEPTGNRLLRDSKGKYYPKTPYNLNGIQFEFGVAAAIGN